MFPRNRHIFYEVLKQTLPVPEFRCIIKKLNKFKTTVRLFRAVVFLSCQTKKLFSLSKMRFKTPRTAYNKRTGFQSINILWIVKRALKLILKAFTVMPDFLRKFLLSCIVRQKIYFRCPKCDLRHPERRITSEQAFRVSTYYGLSNVP